MVGTNKNFRRKLGAPARNDQEVFMAIKTHLALSSPIELQTFPRGVALSQKNRINVSFSVFFVTIRFIFCILIHFYKLILCLSPLPVSN